MKACQQRDKFSRFIKTNKTRVSSNFAERESLKNHRTPHVSQKQVNSLTKQSSLTRIVLNWFLRQNNQKDII